MTPADIRKLHLVVTYLCNHKCGFCPQVVPNRADIKLGEDAVENLAACFPSLRQLVVSGGEAFLWKPLQPLVHRLTELNPDVRCALVTNGTVFSPYWLDKARAGFFDKINLSINAGTAATYRRIHGVDHFDKVMALVAELSGLRRHFPLWLTVSCVVNRLNLGEMAVLAERVAGLVDEVVFQEIREYPEIWPFFAQTHLRDQDRETLHRQLDAAAVVAHHKATRVTAMVRSPYRPGAVPPPPPPPPGFAAPARQQPAVPAQCPLPWEQVTVDIYGDVLLGCCNTRHVIGNINRTGLGEMLDNPVVDIVHDRVTAADFDFCADPRTRMKCPFPNRTGDGA